jgi:hypothetical protein
LRFYGVQLGERHQQLASPFAELTNFFPELLGGLDDLLTDIGFTREAQIVFIPALNYQSRDNSKNHQQQKPAGQPDPYPAAADEPARSSPRLCGPSLSCH